MLVIRADQMKVFEQAALQGFENDMAAHLGKFSPPLCQAIGDEQLHKTIRFGIGRAESHGFTFRGPVRFYLELMFLLGSHFDTDPQYPWAAEILQDQDSLPQMERADLLYGKTVEYRQKVAGPKDAYTIKALKNILALARQSEQRIQIDSDSALRQQLLSIYPQKAAFIGDEGLAALSREARDKALSHQFSQSRGTALLFILMFTLGHGCCDDFLYPWISRTLRNEKIPQPDARAGRLEKKASTWLEQVLAYFEQEMRT